MKAYRKGSTVKNYDTDNGWVQARTTVNKDALAIHFEWGEGQKKSDFMIMVDDVEQLFGLMFDVVSILKIRLESDNKPIDAYTRAELTTELFNRL